MGSFGSLHGIKIHFREFLYVFMHKRNKLLGTTGHNSYSSFTKTVTIKTPANRTGYDTGWQANFKKAFGISCGSNTVNITLTIETIP
jgi:hypothetical protein